MCVLQTDDVYWNVGLATTDWGSPVAWRENQQTTSVRCVTHNVRPVQVGASFNVYSNLAFFLIMHCQYPESRLILLTWIVSKRNSPEALYKTYYSVVASVLDVLCWLILVLEQFSLWSNFENAAIKSFVGGKLRLIVITEFFKLFKLKLKIVFFFKPQKYFRLFHGLITGYTPKF